jgi:hypothetical protein
MAKTQNEVATQHPVDTLPLIGRTVMVRVIDGELMKGVVIAHSAKDGIPTFDYVCALVGSDGRSHFSTKWARPEQVDEDAVLELEMGAYIWSADSSAAASAQGWNLFEARGDFAELQFQRDDEAEIFSDDAEAAKHLAKLVEQNDPLAIAAVTALLASGSSDILRFKLTLPG